jgi:cyclic pyranopterin phosphate synthase
MVDISAKASTAREAVAVGRVQMSPATLSLLSAGGLPKGDVLAVAQVAGVMAAKETARLIPMCHQLLLSAVEMQLLPNEQQSAVEIRCRVRTTGQTGAEMEALTAVSVAALTVYDMCKAVDKQMIISEIHLVEKSGGKSGDWRWPEHE